MFSRFWDNVLELSHKFWNIWHRLPFPFHSHPTPDPTIPRRSLLTLPAIWDFEGVFCTSRHIPHVKFAGLIHPGILGCAPSAEVRPDYTHSPRNNECSQSFDRFWKHGISVKESLLQQTSLIESWHNLPTPQMFMLAPLPKRLKKKLAKKEPEPFQVDSYFPLPPSPPPKNI